MIPPQSVIYVDKAHTADYASAVGSASIAEYAKSFDLSGTVTLSGLNIVGGGVTGSFGTNQVTSVSASQAIDLIPLNKGNSVKWFVFLESGSNSRANKVVASWNYTTSSFYTTEIKSVGNTPVDLRVSHSYSGVSLMAYPQEGTWSLRLIRILI